MPVPFPADLVLEVAKNCFSDTCQRLPSGWLVSFSLIQAEANLLRLDYTRLRSLCLISRSASVLVQPLLYRDVVLRTASALQAFQRTLDTAPHLGLQCQTFVGTLHAERKRHKIDDQTKCAIHDLEDLSSKCPKLQALMFFSFFETRSSSELQHVASRLPIPRYWWAMNVPEDDCMKPAALASTTELSLWFLDPFLNLKKPASRFRVDAASGKTKCVMYSRNEFVWGGSISPRELHDRCSNLTALCITQRLSKNLLRPLINSASTKLQRLCLTDHLSTEFDWEINLGACTQLQHLTIGVKFRNMYCFFESLPQQLSELYLVVPLPWKMIQELTKAMGAKHTCGTYVHLPSLSTFYAKLQNYIAKLTPLNFYPEENWSDYVELKILLELREELPPERFEAIRWQHPYFEKLPDQIYDSNVIAWRRKHHLETKTEPDVDVMVEHFHAFRKMPSFENLRF